MAGRPRTPTNILHLNGAMKRNPGRYNERAHEPKPSGEIGDPPAWMDEAHANCWRDIVADAPPGVLSNADRGLLTLMVPLRLHSEGGDPYVSEDGKIHETIRVYNDKRLALLLRCYTELGFTPASRSKVQAKQVEDAPVNQFAAV
jgi:phage terminase small subunit